MRPPHHTHTHAHTHMSVSMLLNPIEHVLLPLLLLLQLWLWPCHGYPENLTRSGRCKTKASGKSTHNSINICMNSKQRPEKRK